VCPRKLVIFLGHGTTSDKRRLLVIENPIHDHELVSPEGRIL
jgi:hypothetical protein